LTRLEPPHSPLAKRKQKAGGRWGTILKNGGGGAEKDLTTRNILDKIMTAEQ
jgi:hypothetical protein